MLHGCLGKGTKDSVERAFVVAEILKNLLNGGDEGAGAAMTEDRHAARALTYSTPGFASGNSVYSNKAQTLEIADDLVGKRSKAAVDLEPLNEFSRNSQQIKASVDRLLEIFDGLPLAAEL